MIRPNYIIIPLITIIAILLGKVFSTSCDASTWYQALKLPPLTPAREVFPVVWMIIFGLTMFVIILVWNSFKRDLLFWCMIVLFALNAFLNVFWTYLFFNQHLIRAALLDAVALEFVTILLFGLLALHSKIVALLLLPYVVWNFFAIYLNYMMWMLN